MPDAVPEQKEPCYIVILALNSNRKYEDLIKHLKSYSSWATLVSSAWAVVTSKTAAQVRDEIAKFLDEKDRVLVVKSGHAGAWRNFPNSSDWLKKNL